MVDNVNYIQCSVSKYSQNEQEFLFLRNILRFTELIIFETSLHAFSVAFGPADISTKEQTFPGLAPLFRRTKPHPISLGSIPCFLDQKCLYSISWAWTNGSLFLLVLHP